MTAQEAITLIRKEPDKILDALINEHRTHQQSTVSCIHSILKGYSASQHDLRNEEAVKWAAKATEAEQYFPYI